MGHGPKKGTWIGTAIAAFLCLAPALHAEDLTLRADLAPAFSSENFSASPRETSAVLISSTLFRPSVLEVKDKFYRDYLAGADEAIRLTYQDRWRYHETQSLYYQQRANSAHMDIGTFTNPAVGPTEMDVRSEFARTAFRMRLDAAFRKFLTHDSAKGVRQAQAFMENLKAQNVRVSDEPGAAEVRMGYDVISDVSRLEYVKGSMGVGAYHGTFMSSLTGSKPFADAFSLNAWKDFNNGLPSASLGYNVGGKYFQGGLSKYLNPSVRTEMIAVKPTVNNGVTDSVLLRMTYTF